VLQRHILTQHSRVSRVTKTYFVHTNTYAAANEHRTQNLPIQLAL